MPRSLADGLYDEVITRELDRALAELPALRGRIIEELTDEDSPRVLARHLGREIERIFEALPAANRTELARSIACEVLERIRDGHAEIEPDGLEDQSVPAPSRRLLALHRGAIPLRPTTPLSTSTLLTNGHGEPAIGHELAHEIASADRIDAIIAFITVGGVRRIREQLDVFARRGNEARLRILTTTFTGTTEVEALDQLAGLPDAEVKVSFDTRRTRLHAKAWLFHRDSGLTTAYIGSANLTATALGDGREWMMKVSAADLPHVVQEFRGTFETLWFDTEFEKFDPKDELQRRRLSAALASETSSERATTLVELRPRPFQEELLDRLRACRELHGRRRNLIVAATGTGKTVIAAIDYTRIASQAGVQPRLLFLAHRREILERSRDTFRHALQDGAFGELSVGGEVPSRFDHVFASVQGAAALLERLGPDHFRHVVVDECHHMPAGSYQAVVPSLQPDQLLGLTATPERADGKSLLPDFDGHVAAELRLWTALDRQLLAPFDYYGISDGTDLRNLRWSRTGYDLTALADLYTGHTARADLVLAQLARRVASVKRIRGLGFCVSVAHAEFMASHFRERGIPALAVHGDTPAEVRSDAARRLREREVSALFTCDLYNEGVDLPFVDTLLFLRPTMSSTLFLQQLGRGLRLDPSTKKESCLVLDFIGQHREEFRFDTTLAAMTGVARPKLRDAVQDGFPFLPSGCSVVLDAVARDTILASLRATLAGARRLAAELKDVAATSDGPITLADFLDASGRELEDVYGDSYGWATVQKLAGIAPDIDEDGEDLSRRFGWLLHLDEPTRLRHYRDALRGHGTSDLSEVDRRRWHMLDFQLNHRGELRAAEDTIAYLTQRHGAVEELAQIESLLEERISLTDDLYPVLEWPLALHRHYERREIVAAVGFVTAGQKGKVPQGGILRLPAQHRELLFVTLDKSGRGFSPTTRYRDYAISADRFHWETQAAASVTRPSGQRYISPEAGESFYLFVRRDQTSAYAFLGRVHYEAHSGDRPIGITWRLEQPMSAALFDAYATLASP